MSAWRIVSQDQTVSSCIRCEEERLRGLLRRCDVIGNAHTIVLDAEGIYPEAKARTLEGLAEMRKEAGEQFSLYKQEFGISDRSASSSCDYIGPGLSFSRCPGPLLWEERGGREDAQGPRTRNLGAHCRRASAA